MSKSLILTGWSKSEYVAGAAAALEALKGKADVAGVSMNRLADVMSERGPDYAAVYVIGVGLKMNIAAILAALKTLKAKGVKTVWISSVPVAPEFAAEVCIDGAEPSERGFDDSLTEGMIRKVDLKAVDWSKLVERIISFDYYWSDEEWGSDGSRRRKELQEYSRLLNRDGGLIEKT